MNRTIGTCSICGGNVTLPNVWGGVVLPTPTCERCGATAKPPELPAIPMNPRQTPSVTSVKLCPYCHRSAGSADCQRTHP